MKLKIYSTDVKSYNLLMNDVVTWKIDAVTAEKVFDYRAKAWGTEVWEFNQKLASKLNISDDQAKLLKKYFNGDIRKLAKDWKMNFGKLCVKLKDFQDKLLTVWAEKEALMINLINNGRMKNLDDIDHIIKNIDNINLTWLSPEQIKTLTKELSKDVSLVNDANKIDALIKNIKTWANTTMSAAELAKLHWEVKVGSRVISKTWATWVVLEMKWTWAIVQYGNATTYTELTNLNAQEHIWRETELALRDKPAKELFSRTSQDIDKMVRDLKDIWSQDKSAKALVKQIESLKDFAQNIKNLSPQEVTKIAEVLEHISMKSIAILSHNVKDFEWVLKQAASWKTFSALELKWMLTSQVDDKIVEALVKDINAFGTKVNKIAKINESIMKFAEVLAKFIRK